jgi:hypothetical protein
MKQNTGIAALVLVLATFFGISSLPKKDNKSAGASESRSTPSIHGTHNAKATAACKEIRDRLTRFLPDPSLPSSCYTDNTPPPATTSQPSGLQFVIATVPDPVKTHLSLLFDRSIEALQQAAQDENYSYDSSWFPWSDGKTYSPTSETEGTAATDSSPEDQPGIIVFRKGLPPTGAGVPYSQGLVIFLVGEMPAGGLNDLQFENAVKWVSKLGNFQGPPSSLRIIGPTFSGTLPTLARELVANNITNATILSGTVSSGPSYRWFQSFLKSGKEGRGTFKTFMEDDSVMMDRFCGYIRNEGYRLDRIAILSEDETAFGKEPANLTPANHNNDPAIPVPDCSWGKAENTPFHLYYPRDIASLRSAYEQQSIFTSSTAQQSQTTPGTTLRGDLSEPSGGDHDSMHRYSGQLTPLAQESVLLGMASILRERRIQFVVLRSTNTLDQIFLSQFLRRSYPSVRIVIDGSDLLFHRGSEGSSLRGVMLLSSYPLLTWEQDWTPSSLTQRSRSYRVFSEDASEGLYIAARNMLSGGHDSETVAIHDYASPFWTSHRRGIPSANRPATWISVIGHQDFWPVAVLDSHTLKEDPPSDFLPSLTSYPDPPQEMLDLLHLPVEMLTLLIVCVSLAAWHLYCCWHGTLMAWPRPLAYFVPRQGTAHHRLIFVGSFLIAILGMVVGGSSGLLSSHLADEHLVWQTLITIAITTAALAACVRNYMLPELGGEVPPNAIPLGMAEAVVLRKRKAFRGGAFLSLAIVLIWLAYYCFLIRGLNAANSLPTYWRSIHILSGVSPLVPQVLLVFGLYAWFWSSLHGITLFGSDRPMLPGLVDLPTMMDGISSRLPMYSQEGAAIPIEKAAVPFSLQYAGRLVFMFLLTIAAFALALQGFSVRSLGEHTFGVTILFCLSLCIALVLTDTLQLLTTWSRLRQLLVYLDRLPLRRTLDSLKGLAWGSVWKIGGNVLEERYRVVSRQLESLRHLRNTIAVVPSHEISRITKDAILGRLDTCLERGMDFVDWYVRLSPQQYVTDLGPMYRFQQDLAATAGFVIHIVLMPAWRQETESLIFDSSSTPPPAEQEEANSYSPPPCLSDYVRRAEEFVVLPYLGFIQNVLGRIRTIVIGSLCLFVGATFAVSSYPFDPLPVLAGVFLAVFIVAGATVIFVYAEMYRDATLSHITNSTPGQLGGGFWVQVITFGIGPLLGLLTTLFPSITNFVASWLQPGMQALK